MDGSLSKILRGRWLATKPKLSLIDCSAEKVSLAGIARAAGNLTTVGATVRQRQIPAGQQGGVGAPKAELSSDGAEGWTVVPESVTKATSSGCGSKKDVQTREIVGVHIGDRRAESSTLGCGSHCPRCTACSAVIYSDFWSAYADVLPSRPAGVQWAHKQEKLAILNASIALYVSACHV